MPRDGSRPAVELPDYLFRWAVGRGADVALAEGHEAVVTGMHGEHLLVCAGGCCLFSRGSVIVVPDVMVAELAANHPDADAIDKGMRLARADGRSVRAYVNRSGGGPATVGMGAARERGARTEETDGEAAREYGARLVGGCDG